jgi:hypothetical protein
MPVENVAERLATTAQKVVTPPLISISGQVCVVVVPERTIAPCTDSPRHARTAAPTPGPGLHSRPGAASAKTFWSHAGFADHIGPRFGLAGAVRERVGIGTSVLRWEHV